MRKFNIHDSHETDYQLRLSYKRNISIYNLSKKLSYPDRLRIDCTYNASKIKTVKAWIHTEPEELYIHLKLKRCNKIAGAIFKKLEKLVDQELVQRKVNMEKLKPLVYEYLIYSDNYHTNAA